MWDFNSLTMQFAIQGKWFTLNGMVFGKMQVATKKQVSKLSKRTKGPCTLLMTEVVDNIEPDQGTSQKAVPRDLYRLLEQYKVLFEVPR